MWALRSKPVVLCFNIKLEDNSSMSKKSRAVQAAHRMINGGQSPVHFSENLVPPDVAMSLLSITALVNNNISVLFVPGGALMIDIENEFCALGRAHEDADDIACKNTKRLPINKNNRKQTARTATIQKKTGTTSNFVLWHKLYGHTASFTTVLQHVTD